MNTKSRLSIFIAITTAINTFACLGGAPATGTPAASTEASQSPTQEVVVKESKLEIMSTNSYVDSYNDYNVVGEIANNTNDNLENVTLSLSIMDANGASLLKDNNDNLVDQIDIQPYITTLAPGTVSPFNYYVSAGDSQPAKYAVSIKSYDPSSAPKPIRYDIQNVQTAITGDNVVITGEVVNMTSQQMDVEAVAGSLLDDKNNVLAANSTLTYAHYLYPTGDSAGRDRGPFVIKLFGPVDNVTQWKVYARPVENWTTPSVDMGLQFTGSYFDSYGTYHLLGTLTNNDSSQISPSIIGSLQNQDQTILDAASLNVPFYLNEGESTPFDINTFQVVDSLPDNASSAETVLKPDLYWTFHTSYKTIPLGRSSVNIQNDDYSWTATGTVTNTSNQKLNNINAMIECMDVNNQLIVVGYTSIYPDANADAIQPGVKSDFSIDLYPPADTQKLNNCSMSFQGIVAE